MSSPAKPVGASNLLQLLDALPDLNKSDLKILLHSVEQELDKHIEIDRELYHLVFEVVGAKPIALSKFTVSDNGAIWRKNVSAFTDLEKRLHGPKPPKQGVKLALRRFMVELLIEDLKAAHRILTIKNVCNHLGQVQEAFERQFPDYLKNGWEGVVIAQLGGNNES